jgi:hypothetical protein
MKKLEVLVSRGCPNIEAAVRQARVGIDAAGVPTEIKIVLVESDADARRLRFLGSPTVRVDGVDVESAARARDAFAMQCRVYAVDGRVTGAPPAEWITTALRGLP